MNNTLKYTHATGHVPTDWDPDWVKTFEADHTDPETGQAQHPTEQDWHNHLLSLKYPGNGPNGTWTQPDWLLYRQVRTIIGNDLLSEIGKRGGIGALLYTAAGMLGGAFGMRVDLRSLIPKFHKCQAGPDGTTIILSSMVPQGTGAITLGNVMVIDPTRDCQAVRAHEYIHVLQYRKYGIGYKAEYERAGGYYNWQNNSLEVSAVEVERLYEANPWLPRPWELRCVP